MAKPLVPSLEIVISLSDKTLTLIETLGSTKTEVMKVAVVSGCDSSGTPTGSYKGGKWIKDKTNTTHGPIAWSKDNWANPYGPYFCH